MEKNHPRPRRESSPLVDAADPDESLLSNQRLQKPLEEPFRARRWCKHPTRKPVRSRVGPCSSPLSWKPVGPAGAGRLRGAQQQQQGQSDGMQKAGAEPRGAGCPRNTGFARRGPGDAKAIGASCRRDRPGARGVVDARSGAVVPGFFPVARAPAAPGGPIARSNNAASGAQPLRAGPRKPRRPAVAAPSAGAKTTPLPPLGTPLTAIYRDLQDRVAHGDAAAACRLAFELDRCAKLPWLREVPAFWKQAATMTADPEDN